MDRINVKLPERQRDLLFERALQASLPMSELLRRVLDHSLQEERLNAILPAISGSFQDGRRT